MTNPVYYNKSIDKKADIYALVPVTLLPVVRTERTVDDDFIATAVKRFKKQDALMSHMEIAEKLCQAPELIKKITDDIKDEEKQAKDIESGEKRYRRALNDKNDLHESDGETKADVCGDVRTGAYVVFNHITGVICRNAVAVTDLIELQTNDLKIFSYKSQICHSEPVGKDFSECCELIQKDGGLAPEVRRLLVDVDLDPDMGQYRVIDVYPNGYPIKAYIAVSVKWTRISLGKGREYTVASDNWSIGSIRSKGKTDIGMRDKIINDTKERFVDFRNALEKRFKALEGRYGACDNDNDMSSIREIDNKYNLRLNADLRRLIWERQEAITAAAEREKRGVYEKCCGVLEREICAILDREPEEKKERIKDSVCDMRDAVKKQTIERLFADAGLRYKDGMYDYFAGVCGKKAYGMLFEEKQADLFTAIIALLVRYAMDWKYEPVERLKTEYADFMVEFDNLDILNKRNMGKHEGQAFEADGVVRFAGKMEKALYGINIIEELGPVKRQNRQMNDVASLGDDAAKRLGLNEDTELRRRFTRAYASFVNSDSSFYADCENTLIELYRGAPSGLNWQDDRAKRNETVIECLSNAGFDKTMLSGMPVLKSGTGKQLLAQKFLDMIAHERFIKVLVENKQALRLVNELYEDIGHNGKPFEIKRCAQYLELVETQITEVSKFSQ
ncbi:MAG: hypothetical protein LBB74_10840 [Chitinispirillales bacterium]|jgi:hypothetical protein|nr:hypothetical protein [Chitinispirillales bacterium]